MRVALRSLPLYFKEISTTLRRSETRCRGVRNPNLLSWSLLSQG